MRIIAIYPAFDVRINEMAMVWDHLCTHADVSCMVFAGTRDTLKGFQSATMTEEKGSLRVHRLQPLHASPEILAMAEAFRPDVIYCAVTENLRFARALRRRTGAPIVLHTEFFLDDLTFLRKRYHAGFPPLRTFAGAIGRTVLHRMCDAIIVSNPVEYRLPGWQRFERLHYLPWPHPGPGNDPAIVTCESDFSAHIGSLSHGKGARFIQEFYTALLTAEPSFRFLLVGPAIDDEGRKAAETLHRRFPDRVTLMTGCSRSEAMHMLARSLFVFSPAHRYGWGLIGDAWGTGTAVLSRTEHYDLKNGENCLVVPDESAFVMHAQALKKDAGLRRRITAGGSTTVAAHTPAAVAEALKGILQGVITR